MKQVVSRKIEQLVEEQINKASIRSSSRASVETRRSYWPVITISREPCAGGTTLGRSVAERLGFACWDQELLTRIAERSGAVESILASVDERVHSSIIDFVPIVIGRFRIHSRRIPHGLNQGRGYYRSSRGGCHRWPWRPLDTGASSLTAGSSCVPYGGAYCAHGSAGRGKRGRRGTTHP